MTFELGINYWPRRRAMYMWRDFDLGEVREDMSRIADMGFDVVRLLTLTEDFLPEPMTVDARMVTRLVDVARAAKDAGLRVVPTLIVINMSGRIWWPKWMLDSHGAPRDLLPIRRSWNRRRFSSRPAPAHWREMIRSAHSMSPTRSTTRCVHGRERPAAVGRRRWRPRYGAARRVSRCRSAHTSPRWRRRTTCASTISRASPMKMSCTPIRSTPMWRAPFSIRSWCRSPARSQPVCPVWGAGH